ncbi:NADH-quinone oxidoreductase subunit NuoN [Erythrobacter arachoides]|uniref:NADH-quinone oxidoreductase subunit N n=1 Tax=Aurantiacibacter arachoides TaxID=1850444 RepID=A0A845A0S9_9SPHN|nr:NADH-quinone oxidoreductase subunit NuoN [Aurantiacibacter arachoides]MXO93082.1 NADH-quinone oxidoreductase subunit NuoN [Aurantiacibacter arachoides]GGD52175.1 NADH-quinone oxidoreductase subunit N [Aurantiacibacter arachoides]
MDLTSSLGLIAPEIVLSLSGLVLLLFAAWGGDKLASTISIATCIALGAAFFLVAPAVCAGASGPDRMAFGGQFSADAFAGFAKLMIYAAAGAALVVAPRFFESLRAMRAEFPLLVLFAALGMSVMVSATDLVTLYIGLELNSLSAYVLASILRDDERSAEAGLKYFVLGALASGILLFGMSLIYGFTGTTSFAGIAVATAGGLNTGMLFGLIFVLAGLAFKISAAPFHMWTPDVYTGAPTPVTMFFASAPKVAAIALLARVTLEAFGTQVDAWRQVVIFAALLSIVIGALGAIGQTNIKRLMAYSSINNVGFILIGLAAASVAGVSAMLVYLAIYVVMTIGSFVAVLLMRDAEGRQLEGISDLAGLSTTRPLVAWCLLALMFSLAGIPPLFGFWGKFVVFQAAVQADLVALAAIGIAASVIGAFYYIKIVKVMFFDDPADTVRGASDLAHTALLVICALLISPLGYLLIPWLGNLANLAAASLALPLV